MKKDKLITIKCPQCGCEYLPAEIYVPEALIGRPKYIERDIDGRILNCYGKMFDPNEEYICDKCNTKFKIKADVKFKTYIDHKTNFNENFKMTIKKNSLFLKED